jgi:hypothetical protein
MITRVINVDRILAEVNEVDCRKHRFAITAAGKLAEQIDECSRVIAQLSSITASRNSLSWPKFPLPE